MKYSEKIEKVQPSATLGITSKAKAMKKEGKDVVVLAAGEPDFDTPQFVKEAAEKAIKEGFTKYTPSDGTVTLKEAICRKFSKENGLKYNADEIVVSNGAKHSLYNIFQVILNPGDEVIIIHPYWLSYPEMVVLAGGVPRFIVTSQKTGFKASPKDISGAITARTKAIVINSPSNPTGVVYDENDLKAIAEVCVSKNILMISDEIYEKIIFDDKKHVSIASGSEHAKKNTIVVNGVSKSFSMTGWRIGYMAGDRDLMKKISILQDHSTSNPSSISQAAAECAMTHPAENWIEENRRNFEKRRDVLFGLLSGIKKIKPFKPQGAFYMFCDISATGMDSVTFCGRLLEEKYVAVIPGKPFGADDHVRISFATSTDVLEKGVRRIAEWIGSL